MTDMIKELLEEFPELKEDSDKLEKVVQYLENSKPNIEASMEFKDSLRKRLDNIIEIKKGKKKRFWYFAVPAFSFCLVVSLVFVYYKNITQIDNSLDLIERMDVSDQHNKIAPNMFDGELGEESIVESDNFDQVEGVEENMMDSTTIIEGGSGLMQRKDIDFAEIDSLINESESLLLGEQSEVDAELDSNESAGYNNDFVDTTITDENIGEEMDDVMNLLEELFKGIDNEGNVVNEAGTGMETITNTADGALPLTGGAGEISSGVYSFKEYCDYQKGFVVNTGNGRTCRKRDGTECLEANYDTITNCEFVPIN